MADDNDDKVRTSATTKVITGVGALGAGALAGMSSTKMIATSRLLNTPEGKDILTKLAEATTEAAGSGASIGDQMKNVRPAADNLAAFTTEHVGSTKKAWQYLEKTGGGKGKVIAIAAGATIAIGAIIYGIGHHHAKKKFAERELERRAEAATKKPDGPAM